MISNLLTRYITYFRAIELVSSSSAVGTSLFDASGHPWLGRGLPSLTISRIRRKSSLRSSFTTPVRNIMFIQSSQQLQAEPSIPKNSWRTAVSHALPDARSMTRSTSQGHAVSSPSLRGRRRHGQADIFRSSGGSRKGAFFSLSIL